MIMSCAGCGATVDMYEPGFEEWWKEHGKCLKAKYAAEPPPEIDWTLRQMLTGKGRGE